MPAEFHENVSEQNKLAKLQQINGCKISTSSPAGPRFVTYIMQMVSTSEFGALQTLESQLEKKAYLL